MSKYPNRIWLKANQVGAAIHFRVVDREFGEEYAEAHVTHLIYHTRDNSWSGFVMSGEQRFILSPRQAFFLFQGFFNLGGE